MQKYYINVSLYHGSMSCSSCYVRVAVLKSMKSRAYALHVQIQVWRIQGFARLVFFSKNP